MKPSEIKWSLLVWLESGDQIRKSDLTHDELDAEVAELRKTYDMEQTCVRNFECVYVAEKIRHMKDLKIGEFFTLKKTKEPKESQVYVRDEYDRSERKYWAKKWSDISAGKFISGDTRVYTEFTF